MTEDCINPQVLLDETNTIDVAAVDNGVQDDLKKRLARMEEMYVAHEEIILELKTENLILKDRVANLECSSRPASSISLTKSQSSGPISPRKISAPSSPRKSIIQVIFYQTQM